MSRDWVKLAGGKCLDCERDISDEQAEECFGRCLVCLDAYAEADGCDVEVEP